MRSFSLLPIDIMCKACYTHYTRYTCISLGHPLYAQPLLRDLPYALPSRTDRVRELLPGIRFDRQGRPGNLSQTLKDRDPSLPITTPASMITPQHKQRKISTYSGAI